MNVLNKEIERITQVVDFTSLKNKKIFTNFIDPIDTPLNFCYTVCNEYIKT